MAFLSTINIIGSGMTAHQTRLDVISENITNMNTTRTEEGGAYRRKIVVMEAESGKNGFRMAMERAAERLEHRGYTEHTNEYSRGARAGHIVYRGHSAWVRSGLSNRGYEDAGGVHITEIGEDESEMPLVYDPTHPDANEAGYVEMPNVTLVKEVTDAMAASQAFSADVTAFNTLKQVVSRALEIGR